MKNIGYFLGIVGWLMGMVLAHGGLKLVAFIFPPYAWYLLVEKLMKLIGII